MWTLNLFIALIFSSLGAMMAFIITYEEYLRHFPDKKRPLKLAGRTAAVAFLFLVVVSFLMTLGIGMIFKSP